MKTDFRKAISMILVLILFAATTIVGFTVSAAHSTNASPNSEKGEASSLPQLKNGVWQAVYDNGGDKLFFINTEESSFSLIDPERGIGIPSRYDYDDSNGIYKLHLGSEENVENWLVIDNNDTFATVSDAKGELITLYYIADDTAESFRWFTLFELKEMARCYYDEHFGSSEGVEFTASILEDGSFFATITGTKNGVETASYTVDMTTAAGTDNNDNKIDLSPTINKLTD